MKILLLLNVNNININSLEDCKTKIELFALMLKTHIKSFNNIELYVDKCFPCTEMKTTFKRKNINNFKKVDHIIFLDDSGLYRKHSTFLKHLKNYSATVSTICKHPKFFNGEDLMFTYNDLLLNKHTHYIPPPLDESIYTPLKDGNTIYILLDQVPKKFILKQIYNLISINSQKNDIIFKVGIINKIKVDFIDIYNDDDDILFNSIYTEKFNLYIDYVHELAKANIFISTRQLNDIYLLYELAMCNTLHVSKLGLVENDIIDELDLCVFDESIEINWKEIFNKLNTYDIRQKLIDNNYTWNKALSIISNNLSQLTPQNDDRDIKQLTPIKKGYCLNIVNKNRPVVVNLDEIHKKRAEKNKIKEHANKKKRVIIQSQLLKQK